MHEDFGVFSYDSGLKKIVWRQFHSEGLVNEYILESAGADGKSLEFVTTKIENLPSFRDKKEYRIVSSDGIAETFVLAAPGKGFEVYTEARLTCVKRSVGRSKRQFASRLSGDRITSLPLFR